MVSSIRMRPGLLVEHAQRRRPEAQRIRLAATGKGSDELLEGSGGRQQGSARAVLGLIANLLVELVESRRLLDEGRCTQAEFLDVRSDQVGARRGVHLAELGREGTVLVHEGLAVMGQAAGGPLAGGDLKGIGLNSELVGLLGQSVVGLLVVQGAFHIAAAPMEDSADDREAKHHHAAQRGNANPNGRPSQPSQKRHRAESLPLRQVGTMSPNVLTMP
jgi:hypothetical protein